MNRRDRTFLTELAQFTHKNHIASAYIYRTRLNSREELEDVAVFTEDRLRHYASLEIALEDVRKHNEGIFLRYLSASVGQAASFFDDFVVPLVVLFDPSVTIGTLLDLPDVGVL